MKYKYVLNLDRSVNPNFCVTQFRDYSFHTFQFKAVFLSQMTQCQRYDFMLPVDFQEFLTLNGVILWANTVLESRGNIKVQRNPSRTGHKMEKGEVVSLSFETGQEGQGSKHYNS